MKEIYLDNAAAAPMTPSVTRALIEAFKDYGNPSSFNDAGRAAKQIIKDSRRTVASFLGARPDEIIFASSGSEANNLAIFGSLSKHKAGEIVTSSVEHPSVSGPLKSFNGKGWKVVKLRTDKEGFVSNKNLENKLTQKTVLISVMYANNEIGTIEPILELGKTIKMWREKNNTRFPYFHTDACQAAGYLNCNVSRLGVDLLTINGSKLGGPKGSAVLYVRRGIHLSPLVYGGDQEAGLRAGSENVPAIAGLARAIQDLKADQETARLTVLRDELIDKLTRVLPGLKINGPSGRRRLPNNVHLSLPNVSSENLLIELDKYGIRAGSGSACTAHSVEPSHVLRAIGVENKYLGGALRISMGWQTKKTDIDYLLKVLPRVVKDLKRRYRVVKT